MNKKEIKEYILATSATILILIFGAIGAVYLCKKEAQDYKIMAQNIKPEGTTFHGEMRLYDIIKFKEEKISVLTLSEVINKKPPSLWEWGTIKELKSSNEVNFTKNSYLYVYTKPNK